MTVAADSRARLTLWELEQDLVEALEEPKNDAENEAREELIRLYLLDVQQKRDRVAGFLNMLSSYEVHVEEEIARLEKRRADTIKARKRLESYVLRLMEAFGKTKLEGDLYTFVARRNPPHVEVTDPLSIPSDYLKVHTSTAPDKQRIREAISRGETVPGAEVVSGDLRLEIQ